MGGYVYAAVIWHEAHAKNKHLLISYGRLIFAPKYRNQIKAAQ